MPEENKNNKQAGPVSDHLANERTFLAWVRTSIGIMAFGFVVVKFSLFLKQLSVVLQKPLTMPGHGYSSVMGISLVGFGALLNILAFLRYRLTGRQINGSTYKTPALLTAVLALSIVLTGILLVIYLIQNVKE